MNTCIKYPNNSTSLILGRALLRDDHNVFLFCPSDTHRRLAHTIPLDLQYAAIGLQGTVTVIESAAELQQMDFVIFPALDCARQETSRVCCSGK